MMSFSIPAATFSLSNNHGMSDEIIARIVAITTDRANVTGFGKRAIVANPGCRLLFPDKEGRFELSGCERSNLSALRLSLLENRGAQAIEYRTGSFYIDLPVTIDHGYDYSARSEDKVTYTAHCLVSVRDEGAFLSSFALSQSNPTITIQMVQNALTRGAITLLGNDVDDMGHIMPRRLYALFNVLGLFLHGAPSITNYVNARAVRLRELQEACEREARESLRQVTQADVDIALKSLETLPQLMASLADSGHDPAEIDRAVASYKEAIRESSKAVHRAHEQAQQRRQALLAEAEQRSNYREDHRPDRLYRQEAARLPQGQNRCLSSGDRSFAQDRYASCEPRRACGPNPRGSDSRPYARQPQASDRRPSGHPGGYRRPDAAYSPHPEGNRTYARGDYRRPSGHPGSYRRPDAACSPRPEENRTYTRGEYRRPSDDRRRDAPSNSRPFRKYGPNDD